MNIIILLLLAKTSWAVPALVDSAGNPQIPAVTVTNYVNAASVSVANSTTASADNVLDVNGKSLHRGSSVFVASVTVNSSNVNIASGTLSVTGNAPTAFSVGASTLVVKGSGFIGLGTSSPATLLDLYKVDTTASSNTSFWNLTYGGGLFLENHVDSANSLTGIGLYGGQNNSAIAGIAMIQETANSLGGLTFYTGGAGRSNTVPERMRITSSGGVGIGITTPAGVLDLGDATSARALSWGGTSANYANIFTPYSNSGLVLGTVLKGNTGADSYLSSNGLASAYRNAIRMEATAAGGIKFYTNPAATVAADSAVTMNERMRIDENGRVGVGTASPDSTVRMTVADGTSGGSMMLGNTSPVANGSSYVYLQSSNSQFNWKVSNNDVYSGDFEITPSKTGGGSVYNAKPALSVGNDGVFISTLAAATSNTLCYNNTIRGSLNTISTCSSSRRYKENINPLDLDTAVNVLNNLDPVTFKWKERDELGIGFVAEEVHAVEPRLTTMNPQNPELVEGVRYGEMSAVLFVIVKNQQKRIADLESRITALESK